MPPGWFPGQRVARFRWVRRIALFALLGTLTAAGCGSGSKQMTTQATSRASYIQRADLTCKNHQSRREDLESQARDLGQVDSKAKAHQIAGLLRQESANRKAEVQELQALQPPSADAATIDSILSLVEAETGIVDRWANAYDDLNEEQIRRLQIRLGVTAGRAAARARAYGFEVCGQQ
jgi:hypothetical protein